MSAKIEVRILCFYRTIMKLESIDYNADFSASTFVAPEGIEWIDQKRRHGAICDRVPKWLICKIPCYIPFFLSDIHAMM